MMMRNDVAEDTTKGGITTLPPRLSFLSMFFIDTYLRRTIFSWIIICVFIIYTCVIPPGKVKDDNSYLR